MLSDLKGPEILLLVIVIVLLFGAKRLPDAARGLGRSLRIFKAETKGLTEDDSDATPTTTVQQIPQTPSAIQAPPVVPPAASPVPPTVPTAEPTTAAAPPADPGANADR